jgi:cytochrome c oxidase subunit 1
MGGLHFWWPKMTGRLYSDAWGRIAAVILFVGFNLTFLPQFVLGFLGMPRRYHVYPPEFQMLNVLSTAGGTILGLGYLIPVFYLLWSLFKGQPAGDNQATGLGGRPRRRPRRSTSIRVVTEEAYAYDSSPEGHRG